MKNKDTKTILLAGALPLMERPYIAFILAIIAGMMNGYTYHVAHLFSTVQSGNIILLGETIATQNWDRLLTIALTVLAFGLGSMFTMLVEILINIKSRHTWTYIILLIEAAILVVIALGFLNESLTVVQICMVISFIAGMQGNGFHKIKGMLYGNVAVTLVVQLAFNYLMQFIGGQRAALKTASLFFLVLLGFAAGGLIGTLTTLRYEELSLLLPAALLVLLAIYTFFMKVEKAEAIDPT